MASASQIIARIQEMLRAGVVEQEGGIEGVGGDGHSWFSVKAENWLKVAECLRDDPMLKLDFLRSITGIDYPEKKNFAVAYDLISMEYRHTMCVKVFLPREKPEVPSVASIWRAADWHEREAYDLLGINFTDHPDVVETEGVIHPRRILLPDDWEGFPLRKDYQFPKEYEGIPGSVEIDWVQKENYPK